MMKKPIVFISFLLSGQLVLAQDKLAGLTHPDESNDFSSDYIDHCIEDLQKDYLKRDKTSYIHPNTLRKLTTSVLSNFTLGYNGLGSNTTNGAIKVGGDETAASVTASFFPKNQTRFYSTVNVSGMIEDNVLSISSGGKHSGGWSTEVNLFFKSGSSIFYYSKRDCIENEKEISKAVLEMKRADFFTSEKVRYRKLLKGKNGLEGKEDRRKALAHSLIDNRSEVEKLLKKGTLSKSEEDIFEALQKKIKEDQQMYDVLSSFCEDICDVLDDSLYAFEKELVKDNPISMHWWKLSLLYGKDSYNTIDTSLQYSDQTGSMLFDRKIVTISYNYFRRSRRYAWSFNGGIGYVYNNSFEGLSKLDLKELVLFDSSNMERQIHEDSKVYDIKETAFKEFNSFKGFVQTQIFFGRKKNIGLDLGSSLTVNVYDDITLGVLNAFAGLIYSNNNSDDQSTIYSLELLFKGKDLTTAVNKKNDVFGKKLDVSVRFVVPLSKLFFQ